MCGISAKAAVSLSVSLPTWVVSASKSGNLSPKRRATGFEEDIAIFVHEEGKAFRPRRDDLVANADLRDRLASMTLELCCGLALYFIDRASDGGMF